METYTGTDTRYGSRTMVEYERDKQVHGVEPMVRKRSRDL
jgi:hypothetical protein